MLRARTRPLAMHTELPLRAATSDSAPVRIARLLVVDDDPAALDHLKGALRAERALGRSTFAGSVTEAVPMIDRSEFDAVLCGCGEQGLALLAHVRESERTREWPFILATSIGEAHLKSRALALGANEFLSKPVSREDLVARVRNLLRLKACEDALNSQDRWLEQTYRERTAELAASRHEIIWRLAKAAESRDDDTGSHVLRVACYCRIIAEALGLSDEFVGLLYLASPLHDIGKIGIPDEVLLKPGRFEPDEWAIMQSHAQLGAEILGGSFDFLLANAWAPDSVAAQPLRCQNPVLDMAAEIAMCHHERWDGSGYPNGIAGTQIPLAARIVAVADVYDALCSARPYKEALPEAVALEIMAEGSGSHFDPKVFKGFMAAIDRIREVRIHFADEGERLKRLAIVAA